MIISTPVPSSEIESLRAGAALYTHYGQTLFPVNQPLKSNPCPLVIFFAKTSCLHLRWAAASQQRCSSCECACVCMKMWNELRSRSALQEDRGLLVSSDHHLVMATLQDTNAHTQGSWWSVCNEVREVCGKRRMAWEHQATRGERPSYFFHWSILLCSNDCRLDTCWTQAGHKHDIWATGGQTKAAVVNRQCSNTDQQRQNTYIWGNLCVCLHVRVLCTKKQTVSITRRQNHRVMMCVCLCVRVCVCELLLLMLGPLACEGEVMLKVSLSSNLLVHWSHREISQTKGKFCFDVVGFIRLFGGVFKKSWV